MSQHTIKASGRSDGGKGASRRLRRQAMIPAIVYGGKAEARSIQIDHEQIWLASQNEWFYSSILGLDVDGKVEQVLLRDMQRHPYRQLIMHLDFQRISANEALRATVPLHFINEEISPAGKAADIVVMKELTQVEVSCLPGDLPSNIEVDLAELQEGDIIHLSQLQLPAGVEIPELGGDKEHDVAVVVARKGRVEATDTDEADAEGEAGEPKAE